MQRFYIKPVGSACYDATGLTYPQQISCDFKEIALNKGANNPRWQNHFGANNLPKVLAFNCTEQVAVDIHKAIEIVCGRHFLVREVNW